LLSDAGASEKCRALIIGSPIHRAASMQPNCQTNRCADQTAITRLRHVVAGQAEASHSCRFHRGAIFAKGRRPVAIARCKSACYAAGTLASWPCRMFNAGCMIARANENPTAHGNRNPSDLASMFIPFARADARSRDGDAIPGTAGGRTCRRYCTVASATSSTGVALPLPVHAGVPHFQFLISGRSWPCLSM